MVINQNHYLKLTQTFPKTIDQSHLYLPKTPYVHNLRPIWLKLQIIIPKANKKKIIQNLIHVVLVNSKLRVICTQACQLIL